MAPIIPDTLTPTTAELERATADIADRDVIETYGRQVQAGLDMVRYLERGDVHMAGYCARRLRALEAACRAAAPVAVAR